MAATNLDERVTKLEKTVSELETTIKMLITNNGNSTRTTTEAIKGNESKVVDLSTTTAKAPAKRGKGKKDTTAASSTAEAASSTTTTTTTKAPNKRMWFIEKWATGWRKQLLESLEITDDTLKTAYKANYEDKKHVAKAAGPQLKAEAAWVYKDYLQTNEENNTKIGKLREQIDTGKISTNVEEANSTDE
jgi:hypothetical protein